MNHNPEILNRITEREINDWLLARVLQARSNGVPLVFLEASVFLVGDQPARFEWTALASPEHKIIECECVFDVSVEGCEKKLLETFASRPSESARLRAEAADLLARAREIEKVYELN